MEDPLRAASDSRRLWTRPIFIFKALVAIAASAPSENLTGPEAGNAAEQINI
jgi:hypothetical protein